MFFRLFPMADFKIRVVVLVVVYS